MSTNLEFDKDLVRLAQDRQVTFTATGRSGVVANSYVLGDTLYLYLNMDTGAYLWVEEHEVHVSS